MTTVSEFQTNVLASLDFLEATIPAGSHVVFLPLADGRVLYDATSNMTHPLGVPFPAVYDFLGCNECSPCLGWLNSNSSFRDATSQRAAELSAVYGKIIAANSTRYTRFDMYEFNVDWKKFISNYTDAGGRAFDLIVRASGGVGAPHRPQRHLFYHHRPSPPQTGARRWLSPLANGQHVARGDAVGGLGHQPPRLAAPRESQQCAHRGPLWRPGGVLN